MKLPFFLILALTGFPAFSFAQGAPAGVSGKLALWLDASNPLGTGVIPADGTLLGTWYDLSGAGNNATIRYSASRHRYAYRQFRKAVYHNSEKSRRQVIIHQSIHPFTGNIFSETQWRAF